MNDTVAPFELPIRLKKGEGGCRARREPPSQVPQYLTVKLCHSSARTSY